MIKSRISNSGGQASNSNIRQQQSRNVRLTNDEDVATTSSGNHQKSDNIDIEQSDEDKISSTDSAGDNNNNDMNSSNDADEYEQKDLDVLDEEDPGKDDYFIKLQDDGQVDGNCNSKDKNDIAAFETNVEDVTKRPSSTRSELSVDERRRDREEQLELGAF